ncbi:hypothetical protein KSP39_PZI000306 [Platanthera zijinensis]|uniref:Uncharacterized protein n=1 Tax=Platanthera zijinensis TaxID=2320716 RepID=A0AAP0C2U5_9ASPA
MRSASERFNIAANPAYIHSTIVFSHTGRPSIYNTHSQFSASLLRLAGSLIWGIQVSYFIPRSEHGLALYIDVIPSNALRLVKITSVLLCIYSSLLDAAKCHFVINFSSWNAIGEEGLECDGGGSADVGIACRDCGSDSVMESGLSLLKAVVGKFLANYLCFLLSPNVAAPAECLGPC